MQSPGLFLSGDVMVFVEHLNDHIKRIKMDVIGTIRRQDRRHTYVSVLYMYAHTWCTRIAYIHAINDYLIGLSALLCFLSVLLEEKAPHTSS